MEAQVSTQAYQFDCPCCREVVTLSLEADEEAPHEVECNVCAVAINPPRVAVRFRQIVDLPMRPRSPEEMHG